MSEDVTRPEEVLEFWANAGPKKWFAKDTEFDVQIKQQFGTTHDHARNDKLFKWLDTPDNTLALVIVLDQFSRNLFRNDIKTYAQDEQCVAIVHHAMANGFDRKMRHDIGMFMYMPLMHSENISDQKLCLKEMEHLELKEQAQYAKHHLGIIEKFGRFPHRNEILGRTTTSAEQAFLEEGGFSG